MADAVIGIIFPAAATDEFDGDFFVIDVVSDRFKGSVKEKRRDGVDNGNFPLKRQTAGGTQHRYLRRTAIDGAVRKIALVFVKELVSQVSQKEPDAFVFFHVFIELVRKPPAHGFIADNRYPSFVKKLCHILLWS